MNKPILKALGVIIIGIGAVVICVIGYLGNNERQHQQRVGYAQTAITDQSQDLEALMNDTRALYNDESLVFLRPGITQEEIDGITNRLSSIKVSANDFGIEPEDLPDGAAEIANQKTAIQSQLDDANSKFKMQQQIDGLFVAPVPNWLVPVNEVVIREDLTVDEVTEISNRLMQLADGEWKAVANEYLTYANAQIERVTGLQNTFNAMLVDGVVTDEVTYQGYLEAVASISEVRNEVLRQQFTEQAQLVATQMGYYSSY